MKKIILNIGIVYLSANNLILAHCHIPCGIYDDALRIIIIKENFQTIKKSMEQIQKLSDLSDTLSKNQLNRWIHTKEQHAQDVQEIISNYFLTQRIKESHEAYTDKLKLLHKLLLIAMRCKQTTDIGHIKEANSLVDTFSKLYFDKHGFEHLEQLLE